MKGGFVVVSSVFLALGIIAILEVLSAFWCAISMSTERAGHAAH